MRVYEKLGIPEGLNKMASILLNKIKKDLKSKLEEKVLYDNDNGKEISFNRNPIKIGVYDININDISIDNLSVFIQIKYIFNSFHGVALSGADIRTYSYPKSHNDNIYIKSEIGDDFHFYIDLIIGNGPPMFFRGTYEYQIIESISKQLNVETVAHELKHLYDRFKEKISIKSRIEQGSYQENSIEGEIKYNSYKIGNLPSIASKFFYLLYYTTSIENSVKPSELYQSMINNKIDKSSFKEFMQNHKMIKTLKNAENFSLDEFKKNLNKDEEVIELVNKAYKKGYESRGSIADDFLNILFVNISNESTKIAKNILKIFVKYNSELSDSKRIADKNFKSIVNSYKKYKDNPEKYYEFLEKRLNFVGKEMIRKLYKLYYMIDQDKSIKNWELHNKINSKNEKIYILDFDKFKLYSKS